MHNIADDVMIIGKETLDSGNVALLLDIDNNITTTSTTYVSSMHEISGFSDYVLGRNGSRISYTNGKHGAVIDGIEWSVGGYDVVGNSFMNIIDSAGTREIYITNDSSKITSTIATAMTIFNKSEYTITTEDNSTVGWKYITEMQLDLNNGIAVQTKSGQTGSSISTGYADGLYFDTSASGQREMLVVGSLWGDLLTGASCVSVRYGVGIAWWYCLCRLSISGVGGELTA